MCLDLGHYKMRPSWSDSTPRQAVFLLRTGCCSEVGDVNRQSLFRQETGT